MDHPVRVLDGDVATIARWHVREYHRRVEPIEPAGCWGWNVRKIGDGPDWSNHAAACAWDLNAPDNPDGVPTSKVMTTRQIAECHALERESGGVLRWGGDWSDPDAMHWEIVGTRAQAAAFAKKIRNEEDDMPNPAEYAQAVVSKFHEDLINPKSGLRKSLPSAVWAYEVTLPAAEGRPAKTVSMATIMQWLDAAELGTRQEILAAIAALGEKVDALTPADPSVS
jgi:hypothetical protein